jgi:hypothetical protein
MIALIIRKGFLKLILIFLKNNNFFKTRNITEHYVLYHIFMACVNTSLYGYHFQMQINGFNSLIFLQKCHFHLIFYHITFVIICVILLNHVPNTWTSCRNQIKLQWKLSCLNENNKFTIYEWWDSFLNYQTKYFANLSWWCGLDRLTRRLTEINGGF